MSDWLKEAFYHTHQRHESVEHYIPCSVPWFVKDLNEQLDFINATIRDGEFSVPYKYQWVEQDRFWSLKGLGNQTLALIENEDGVWLKGKNICVEGFENIRLAMVEILYNDMNEDHRDLVLDHRLS